MKTELSTRQISRISLIVYLVMLILSAFLMCVPGGYIPWYCVTGIFAFPPIVLGPKLYRTLGIIALVLTTLLCFHDYQAGKRWRQKRNEAIKQKDEKDRVETNFQQSKYGAAIVLSF